MSHPAGDYVLLEAARDWRNSQSPEAAVKLLKALERRCMLPEVLTPPKRTWGPPTPATFNGRKQKNALVHWASDNSIALQSYRVLVAVQPQGRGPLLWAPDKCVNPSGGVSPTSRRHVARWAEELGYPETCEVSGAVLDLELQDLLPL